MGAGDAVWQLRAPKVGGSKDKGRIGNLPELVGAALRREDDNELAIDRRRLTDRTAGHKSLSADIRIAVSYLPSVASSTRVTAMLTSVSFSS